MMLRAPSVRLLGVVSEMRFGFATVFAAFGVVGTGGVALADVPERLTLAASVDTSYDSNVAESGSAVAAQRGIRPQDWIFRPAVRVDAALPISDQELFLKGSADYSFYARNSQLNGQTIDFLGGARARLGDCRATLAGEINDSRTRLQDLQVLVTKNVQDIESIHLDGECGRPTGFGPSLSLLQQWSSNSAPELADANYRSTSVTAAIAYRRPKLGAVSLFGTYAQTAYPDRTVSAGGASQQDGYRDYSGGLELDHRLGARVEGTLKVGYTSLESFLRSVPAYSGLDVEGDVSVRFSGRLDGRFTMLRGPVPTIVSNSTYELTTKVTAEADYKISPKLGLKILGLQQTDQYTGINLISGVDIERESIWTVSVTSRYQLNRRLEIDLWASHGSRDADVNIYDYTEDRVGLTFAGSI